MKVALTQAVLVKDPRNNFLFLEEANQHVFSVQVAASRLMSGPKYLAFSPAGSAPMDLEQLGL